MTKFILTVTIAAAALAAGLCFDMPASRASYRDAPWCLVKSGGEDSYWDCEFKTFQELSLSETLIWRTWSESGDAVG